jgi:hypothetical protein
MHDVLKVGLVAAFAVALADCSGGSATRSSAVPTVKSTSRPGSVSVVLKLPARSASSVRRLPAYVSASTQGVNIVITTSSGSTTTAFAVSPSSSNCSTANGATTCVLTATTVGFGSATVAVTLYDQAPTGSTFSSTAATLATGTLAASITEGVANVTLPVVLAGIAQGLKAGALSPVAAGGVVSQGTFVVEASDADGNLILASDGVQTSSGGSISLSLSTANAISGVTMLDVTQSPNGTFATSITGVNVGDRIAVATSAATPQLIGIPILASSTGKPATILRLPATTTVPSPTGLAGFAGSQLILAGVPPFATIDGSTYGNGFILYHNFSGGIIEFATVSNYAPSLASCNTVTEYGVTALAMGAGRTFIAGEDNGSDVTMNAVTMQNSYPGGLCPFGTLLYSTVAQLSLPYGIGSINDVANDGTNAVAAVAAIGSGGNGSNDFVSVVQAAPASNAVTAFGNASNQVALRSLHLWFGNVVAAETGSVDFALRGQSNVPQELALPSAPVSLAVDGQYVYVLDVAGQLRRCAVGAAATCNGAANLSSYGPASTQRAITIGPDGNVWVASSSGLLTVDASALTVVQRTGVAGYTQVTSSGDGRVYALNTNGTVDVFP